MKNSEHYNDPTAHRAITRVMRESDLERMDSLRPRVPTLQTISEAEEQMAVVKWAELMSHKHPCLKWMYHTPNGGSRNVAEAVNLKRMGVKAGVPDLCLPYPSQGYHGLYIEMKTEKGRPSACQRDYLSWLNQAKYKAVCCHSAEEAIEVIWGYINERENNN